MWETAAQDCLSADGVTAGSWSLDSTQPILCTHVTTSRALDEPRGLQAAPVSLNLPSGFCLEAVHVVSRVTSCFFFLLVWRLATVTLSDEPFHWSLPPSVLS